jgi:transcriptional regulator with XRE-family HTH domain
VSATAIPLYARLRARRDELMLSQAEAAEALGVSRRIYQAWESGDVTTPRPRLRRRIEDWLTGRMAS